MRHRLFDSAIIGEAHEALDFIANILESSTEYSIIGFTGTLLMKLPGPLTADQDKQLHTVQGSAKHPLSLINDLLDLAKIESGKVELHLEPVLCQSVLQEVTPSLAASG